VENVLLKPEIKRRANGSLKWEGNGEDGNTLVMGIWHRGI